jgi:2Fe-2S ferredoxin
MPTVTFDRLDKTGEAYECETILDVARRVGAPLGASCGSVGVCARCKVCVLEGADSLTPPTSIELRTMAARGFKPEERLACQAVVRGDVRVGTGYW